MFLISAKAVETQLKKPKSFLFNLQSCIFYKAKIKKTKKKQNEKPTWYHNRAFGNVRFRG